MKVWTYPMMNANQFRRILSIEYMTYYKCVLMLYVFTEMQNEWHEVVKQKYVWWRTDILLSTGIHIYIME